MSSAPPSGTLYVVSTPIGNLEDITLRALRVLREAQVVAAEDTRRTGQLLAHFAITTPTVSLHEHNEHARTPQLVQRLRQGEHIALVTDAGTPLLSDPGMLLVRQAIAEGCRVEPIPGPSAVLSALVAAGIPAQEFAFLGFPPSRGRARVAWYQRAGELGLPFVAFEAPHRLVASLRDARSVLGNRQIVLSRELTKVHEEHLRGSIDEVLARFESSRPRGEFTLVFAGADSPAASERSNDELSDEEVWADFCLLTKSGLTRRDAIADLACRAGRPSRDIYAAVERAKLARRLEEAEDKDDHGHEARTIL